MPFRLPALTIPLILACFSLRAGEAVHLSPALPPIAETTVPLLHIEIPEATGDKGGLTLTNISPHDWLHDASHAKPFSLTAGFDSETYDHAILTAWNWQNEPVAQVRIDSDASTAVEIHIEALGSYLLTLDGFSGGECRKRLIRNVAVTEDIQSLQDHFDPEEFFLGICAFPGRYHWMTPGGPVCPPDLSEQQARDLEARFLARLGFQVVRVDECLEMGLPLEPGQNYQLDHQRMDAVVEAYTSRGFDLALQIMSAPDWAILPKYGDLAEHQWRYPHIEKHQRFYIAKLLDLYGEHARFIQVFNEPDQVEFWAGTPGEFVEQFRFTEEEIRAFSNHLPIANGGYAFVDLDRIRYFAGHLRPLINRPAYHSHGPLIDMIHTFADMRTIHEEAGYQNPIYLNTETGFDSWRLDQDRRQAQALVQKTLYCWANDHRGALLFCGRMVKGPGRDDRDLGLLDYEFCPRFGYAAVAGLVSTLAGATYAETLHQDDDTFAYRFTRGNETIITAFSLAKGKSIQFNTESPSITRIGPMGNREEIDLTSSPVLPLDAYPHYFVTKDAVTCKVISSIP